MNIYESITAIMNDGYSIGKDQRNQQQGFRYRGIDDVMNAFYPLLSKYKVFVVPEVVDRQREERTTTKGGNLIYSILTIKYTFYAEDGSNVSAIVVGEGMDSGDKASNKAMAVGMKYALFQTFCIPTEDMAAVDPDGHTPPESSPNRSAPQGEPDPLEDVNATKFTCAICKKVLVPYKDRNGAEIGIRQHVAGCMKAFGQPLCLDCIKAHYPDAMKA